MKITEIFFDEFLQKVNSKIKDSMPMRGGVYRTIVKKNYLFYVLTRNKNRFQNWGVRAHVIENLQTQEEGWFLILLSEEPNPNFLFTANDIQQIIENNEWNISDGNYKTTVPSLKNNFKFHTIDDFKNKINNYIEKTYWHSINKLQENFDKEVEIGRKLTQMERLDKMKNYPEHPTTSESKVKVYNRNPYVIAEVLEKAKGKCHYCGQDAPFNRTSDETPFLEVHHIVSLSDGGKDTIENTIALCPNCHRGMHYGGFQLQI